ncbi:MAG: ABC transporter ATP-binding protein [Methanomicrobiaceae archaeon]|nr:ABC transporter ATP-binding protein [Methanomicrobiaceae archaeon]
MIHARSLVKEYGGFRALDGVGFDLDDNGIFGVIGHNGAGKTTLLKIMAGLLAPDSGTLHVDGIDVLADPAALKARLGYLPEESRLYETMTVEDYLSFFGEIYGLDRATIGMRRDRLLASLALEPEGKKIGELSKGMRRKVAIARSLIHDPAVLVYDEPTSGLDPMTSRSIAAYLRRLRDRQHKTVILSAHNLYQVEEICDRVMILRRGRTAAFGTMEELREVFGSIRYLVYFTIDDPGRLAGVLDCTPDHGLYVTLVHEIDALNEVSACIAGAGGTVRRIESQYPSLEEMLVKIGM